MKDGPRWWWSRRRRDAWVAEQRRIEDERRAAAAARFQRPYVPSPPSTSGLTRHAVMGRPGPRGEPASRRREVTDTSAAGFDMTNPLHPANPIGLYSQSASTPAHSAAHSSSVSHEAAHDTSSFSSSSDSGSSGGGDGGGSGGGK